MSIMTPEAVKPPAFPSMKPLDHWGDPFRGMDLRDWFAGQALAGIMSNETTPFASDHAECHPDQIAEAVYEIADAMLSARTGGGE